jgi:hypothetical protein
MVRNCDRDIKFFDVYATTIIVFDCDFSQYQIFLHKRDRRIKHVA